MMSLTPTWQNLPAAPPLPVPPSLPNFPPFMQPMPTPWPGADQFQSLPLPLPQPPFQFPYLPPLGNIPGPLAPLAPPAMPSAPQQVWVNDLKKLFHKNQAVTFALNIRTFGAEDRNGDGRISARLGENGTFLSAIKKLDELVAMGINNIHLLPINPIGRTKRLGEAGSLYAPSDYHSVNPEFDTPGNATDALQEARMFIEECHKRGIHVMVDVPSCASLDLAQARPDLILKDAQGRTLTPTNWVDIVMFKNGKALQDYYEGFFNLMVNQLGVDGFRVDVARARPLEFWRHFIGKYPDKAWLAETYTEEDQSPLKNLPRDIPEALLNAGFDSIYGQFHIFHAMKNAKEYTDYLLANRAMFQRTGTQGGQDKSFIGSFLTHDDPALMEKGGVLMSLLASGLMSTQPWTNPYILDGFTTGYTGHFDIFNYVPRHTGSHPEIGLFLQKMLQLRKQYAPILTQGRFIPIPTQGSQQIIAFARQAGNKTLLVVANKDVNARQTGTLSIPGLTKTQPMTNLAPEYGRPSQFIPDAGTLSVNLGPGRFHMFEINTPNLGQQLPSV